MTVLSRTQRGVGNFWVSEGSLPNTSHVLPVAYTLSVFQIINNISRSVTFDSGGCSLTPDSDRDDLRTDGGTAGLSSSVDDGDGSRAHGPARESASHTSHPPCIRTPNPGAV